MSLSGSSALDPARSGIEVYTERGAIDVDTANVFRDSTFARVVDEFVDSIKGHRPHALDARRGLHLQRLLSAAARDL